MTQAMDRNTESALNADNTVESTEAARAFDAAAARIVHEINLYCRLEAVAEKARQVWGVTHLTVEIIEDAGADIIAVFGDPEAVVDLWDLDPLLWDEANRAAVEFLPAGTTSVIEPRTRD